MFCIGSTMNSTLCISHAKRENSSILAGGLHLRSRLKKREDKVKHTEAASLPFLRSNLYRKTALLSCD